MINYSIVLRKNLQKPEEAAKAYACAQTSQTMDINRFAEHIATHGCVYSRADIAAVLTMAVDCMRETLLNGALIKLGDLGTFAVALQCTGADSAADFRADTHIIGISVNWNPGEPFTNMLDDATFNIVPSRKIARKLMKAIKAGETQVDFAEDETNTGTDTGDNTGSDDSGSTDTGDGGSTGGNPLG